MTAREQLTAILVNEGNIDGKVAGELAQKMLFMDRPRLRRKLLSMIRTMETEMDRAGIEWREQEI
jgi:hypothetical protein